MKACGDRMPDPLRSPRDIAVIGSSAGGVQALRTLLTRIDVGFPGVIAIVQHRSAFHQDSLAHVIADGSGHVVREPGDGEALKAGTVYLAPRDRHLLMVDGYFRIERGPKEHFTRPAIDALFRSAADAHGHRVIGVILTGAGRDGASGLVAIKAAGGLAIVQDPAEAASPGMPRHAVARCEPDYVLPLAQIAARIMSTMNGRSATPRPSR